MILLRCVTLVELIEALMHRPEVDPQETSSLSRFAIPAGTQAPALSQSLVDAFNAAVAHERFDYEEPEED
jgi:hypothetical protein